jgi:hypothetical protein
MDGRSCKKKMYSQYVGLHDVTTVCVIKPLNADRYIARPDVRTDLKSFKFQESPPNQPTQRLNRSTHMEIMSRLSNFNFSLSILLRCRSENSGSYRSDSGVQLQWRAASVACSISGVQHQWRAASVACSISGVQHKWRAASVACRYRSFY